MAEHESFRSAGLPAGEPVAGKTYRADGWAYIDPPTRFSPEMWTYFLSLIGEENYVILAKSAGTSPHDGLPFVRGQLLVSPEGMENMKKSARAGRA